VHAAQTEYNYSTVDLITYSLTDAWREGKKKKKERATSKRKEHAKEGIKV